MSLSPSLCLFCAFNPLSCHRTSACAVPSDCNALPCLLSLVNASSLVRYQLKHSGHLSQTPRIYWVPLNGLFFPFNSNTPICMKCSLLRFDPLPHCVLHEGRDSLLCSPCYSSSQYTRCPWNRVGNQSVHLRNHYPMQDMKSACGYCLTAGKGGSQSRGYWFHCTAEKTEVQRI